MIIKVYEEIGEVRDIAASEGLPNREAVLDGKH